MSLGCKLVVGGRPCLVHVASYRGQEPEYVILVGPIQECRHRAQTGRRVGAIPRSRIPEPNWRLGSHG